MARPFRTALVLIVFCSPVLSAPGQRADTIEGEFVFPTTSIPDSKCPAVKVMTRDESGTWHAEEYWLVFTAQEAEVQALKIEVGTSVKASGRIGGGGHFRYLIVEKLAAVK